MSSISFDQLIIAAMNFAIIGLLPKIFFRSDGSFNLMWWVTASPLFLSPVVLLMNWMGYLPALGFSFEIAMAQKVISIILHCFSMCLMTLTLGGHRVPLALWHQDNDAPKSIVTWGAYKRIRHPFYTSFLLALIASNIACPHPTNFIALIAGFLILNFTAQKEEKKLSQSEFGKEYQEYISRTGRFFPKLRG